MHVSLAFMVHNNQGVGLFLRLQYVHVYRALEFMPVYIYGLQYVTSIVAIVVLRAGNGTQANKCNESYRPHDKEKKQCLLLCTVLNF